MVGILLFDLTIDPHYSHLKLTHLGSKPRKLFGNVSLKFHDFGQMFLFENFHSLIGLFYI